jgi:hypothetical protein
MAFAFMTLRHSTDGWGPDCPDGTEFFLLADTRSVEWGLYSYDPPIGNESWSPPDSVDAGLEALIYSGMRYPPALAIARLEVEQLFRDREPTQQEFAEACAACIHRRLSQQATAPFELARANQGELVDLTPGEWYWILRVKGNPPVASWVSGDYFVYQRAAADFDLSEQQLERLRRNENA